MDILKAALRELFGKLELQKENEKLYNVFKNDKQPLDINDKQFEKLLKESNLNETKISFWKGPLFEKGLIYNYLGMVSKDTGLPNGLGRAIEEKNSKVFEGWFKNGKMHGNIRLIDHEKVTMHKYFEGKQQ
jgi:hypothetical protein